MPVRQFPRALRPHVRVAYAIAWESLIESHREQAQQFIWEFASRVSALEALELYFAVVPVAEAMQEPVRTRTLATLELDCLPARAPLPTLRGMRLLRLDLLMKLIQYRRAYSERTLELARMVGARAGESVLATHVKNAQDFANMLSGQISPQRAVEEYLRAFSMPLGGAQIVMQRVKASLAGSELAAEYAQPAQPDPALLEDPDATATPHLRLSDPPEPSSSPSAA
jgi:hypothetical protein